jgi:cholesterol transport system auxiliary component
MKYALALLTLLILNACTVTKPYVAEYKIRTELVQSKLSSQSCKDKTLKIAQAFSQNRLMTRKMNYAQNDYSEYEFSESEWAESPNNAITQEILQSVRSSKLFRSVQGHKSRSRSAYILESSIEEFIQHFSKDSNNSYVSIVISFTLVDTKSSEPIDTITLTKKVKVDEISAKGGVKAFNKGLNELLKEHNRWLNEVCK